MANFKYHKITKTKKIRYISEFYKDTPFIVFLHGFMSDLEGKKPNSLGSCERECFMNPKALLKDDFPAPLAPIK